jgi:hypothetical protein
MELVGVSWWGLERSASAAPVVGHRVVLAAVMLA